MSVRTNSTGYWLIALFVGLGLTLLIISNDDVIACMVCGNLQ